LKNPKVRRKIVAPLGFVLLLFGAIWLAVPGAAAALVLILAGLYLLMISLPFQSVGDVLDRAGELYNRLRDSVASGNLSIFFIVLAMINSLGVLLASYNLNAALWPIYLSIALAIFLVVTGGLSYRTREPRSETVEDG